MRFIFSAGDRNRRATILAVAVCGAASLAAPGSAWAQRSNPLLPGGNSRAPVSINADKLDYFDKDQKLVYTGNVVAKQGDATLRTPMLVIFLNKTPTPGAAATGETPAEPEKAAAAAPAGASGDQVRRMEASGPVSIVSKDQVGTGDKGIFEKAENKVYLIGHVSLSQGPNVTKGDKLTYDLDSGQARVDGAGRVNSIFTPGSGKDDDAKPKKPAASQPTKSKP